MPASHRARPLLPAPHAISGTVMNIPPGMDEELYSVGLFAYPYPAGGNGGFVVVNCWVEP